MFAEPGLDRLTGLLSAQVVELQNRLSEESKKADKMEFEYKRVKEKVDSLQKEKDVGTVQVTAMSSVNADGHCASSSVANAYGERLSEGDHRGAALRPGPGGTADIR